MKRQRPNHCFSHTLSAKWFFGVSIRTAFRNADVGSNKRKLNYSNKYYTFFVLHHFSITESLQHIKAHTPKRAWRILMSVSSLASQQKPIQLICLNKFNPRPTTAVLRYACYGRKHDKRPRVLPITNSIWNHFPKRTVIYFSMFTSKYPVEFCNEF